MTSSLLICGDVEESLAVAAYGGTVTTTPTDTDTATEKNNGKFQLQASSRVRISYHPDAESGEWVASTSIVHEPESS
jgi:hypothetical protein